MKANMLFVHALSPLHAGTGQGIGVIDLPIAREVATGLPYLPGSSLKGVLRDQCKAQDVRKVVFGSDTGNISDSNLHAGAAQFSDQRLLLLPVRSLAGTFAWVTSPFILQRLQREAGHIGFTCPDAIPRPGNMEQALVDNNNTLTIPISGGHRKIVLEDIDLTSVPSEAATAWADWLGGQLFTAGDWQTTLKQKLCVVHDDVLSFLLETATEIIARNQLTEEKTSNNLWYEEALPAETVLSGIVLAQQVGEQGLLPDAVLQEVSNLTTGMVQLGGNATIGRGLCRILLPTNGG